MAIRPVFRMKSTYPYYEEINVTFHYYAGLALVQRQRNIAAIHAAYHQEYPRSNVLEASSKSPDELGKMLSPFFLMTDLDGHEYPVENVFQAAKVFQTGGPFLSLLDMPPAKAKTTSMTKTHGPLLYYRYLDQNYPIEPKGWLYDWIYLHALMAHPALMEGLKEYDAFTDIAFNPKSGTTCQAKCLAIFKGLQKKGILDETLSSIPLFLKTLFHTQWPAPLPEEDSLPSAA